MLDGLVEQVHSQSSHPISPASGPALEVSDVEAMLAQTPRRGLGRDHASAMHTDSYDLSTFESSEFADETGTDTDPDESVGTASSAANTDDHAATRSSSE